jgi:hypothetical protein
VTFPAEPRKAASIGAVAVPPGVIIALDCYTVSQKIKKLFPALTAFPLTSNNSSHTQFSVGVPFVLRKTSFSS